MHQLISMGVICPLDGDHAYQAVYAQSVAGRITLIKRVIPSHITLCALTACWVWLGGTLPGSIDVISRSHFRSTMFGRKIRVFNRQARESQTTVANGLRLTTPVRTACDIATLPDDEWQGRDGATLVDSLMEEYHFSASDCLTMLGVNRFWPNTPRARNYFSTLPRIGAETGRLRHTVKVSTGVGMQPAQDRCESASIGM